MNYGWLDPLGRVRRQPHWCSHFRVDRFYVEVRLRFVKSSPRWRIVGRERKSRKSTQGSQGNRKQQQQPAADTGRPGGRLVCTTCTGHRGRPPSRPQKEPVDCPVDQLTWPNSRLGTVDRDYGRSTGRPTDGSELNSESCSELETSPMRFPILLGFLGYK